MKRNWVGHNEEGTSDKLYFVCVRDNSDKTFTVLGKWGRRGRLHPSQSKVYLTTPNESAAYAEKEREVKHRSKRGYVDIESPGYGGSVRVSDRCVQDHLEFSDKFDVSQAKNNGKAAPSRPETLPETDDFIVVCRDNSGMEERFDIGIEYVAERHDDVNMIWVYGKLGERREYFRERFVLAESVDPVTGELDPESWEAEREGILKSVEVS
jgi:predicted DNA-binding WGR domain protein